MPSITIGSDTFKGKTKREAREKADHLLEVLRDDDRPYLVEWRGTAALVFRSQTMWGYGIIVAPNRPIESGSVFQGTCGGDNTREYAIASAVEHVAQIGWRPEDGTEFPLALATHVPNRRRDDVAARHASWTRFQLRYIEERERGLSDSEAHTSALLPPPRRTPRAVDSGNEAEGLMARIENGTAKRPKHPLAGLVPPLRGV